LQLDRLNSTGAAERLAQPLGRGGDGRGVHASGLAGEAFERA
jgi:hypothetical protein